MVLYWILSGVFLFVLSCSIYLLYIYQKGRITRFRFININFLNDSQMIKYAIMLSIMFFSEMLMKLFSNIYIKKFFASVSVIIILMFAVMYVVDSIHDNSPLIKIIGTIFMYLFIVILGLSSFVVSAHAGNNKWIIAISFLLFIIVTAFSIWASFISLNTIWQRLIVLLFIYFLVIFVGGITFGIYYLLNNLWPIDIINSFNTISSERTIALLLKYSLKSFYNFPTGQLLCLVGIAQYYFGKFFDLFILGYIFNMVASLGQIGQTSKMYKNKKSFTIKNIMY